jgi:hypothetical protein
LLSASERRQTLKMGCAASCCGCAAAPPLPPAKKKHHKKKHHRKAEKADAPKSELAKVTEPETEEEAPPTEDQARVRRKWKVTGAVVLATIPFGMLTDEDDNDVCESDDLPEAEEVPPDSEAEKEAEREDAAATKIQARVRGMHDRKLVAEKRAEREEEAHAEPE